MTLEEQVVKKLTDKKYHISFAESCTAGICCATLANVSGASSVLDMSFVTYANEAKISLLGVSAETIERFGVVSESVAGQMASGAAERANCSVGVGVTGVAGPSGGTAAKPVGMVCFGFFINSKVYTYTEQFGNIGRNQVRNASVRFVFEKLLELI